MEHVTPLHRTCRWLLVALRKDWSPSRGLPPALPFTCSFPFTALWLPEFPLLSPAPGPLHRLVSSSGMCIHSSYLSTMAIPEGGLLWIPLSLSQIWGIVRRAKHGVPFLGGPSTVVILHLLTWLTGWSWSSHWLYAPGDQEPHLPYYALKFSRSGAGSGSLSQ